MLLPLPGVCFCFLEGDVVETDVAEAGREVVEVLVVELRVPMTMVSVVLSPLV